MELERYLIPSLIYLAGVFFSACAQILLKTEAMRTHQSLLGQYLNPRVIIGYGITFGCTLLTIWSYRGGLPVSWGNVLESMGYLFVTVLGVTVLGERVTKEKWMALGVILAGILLFALGA